MSKATPTKTDDVSDLVDHLGYWLRAISNQVSHAFASQVNARGVTVAEWVFLRKLYGQPPMLPSQLAQAMGMTRGAISKLADRLLAKALIVRKDDATDGRAHTLALTAKGKALVPALAQLADANDTYFFSALTAQQRQQLRGLLQHLAAHHAITTSPVE